MSYLKAGLIVVIPEGLTIEQEQTLRLGVRNAINTAAEAVEALDPDINVGVVTATVVEQR